MIKVLNLYAGIGGNRKLWKDVKVTAVEHNPDIAFVYKEFFPDDKMIIGDAHEYLKTEYKKFDFIWSSPPCPTHSDIRRAGVHAGQHKAEYPNMELYEEIIFLKHFGRCKWVVENVKSYYDYLIRPFEVSRHYFWSNFVITKTRLREKRIHNDVIGSKPVYGFDISRKRIKEKRQVLRNLVSPELGLHVFNCAFKTKQETLDITAIR